MIEQIDRHRFYPGDCRDLLAQLEDNSVDAVVTEVTCGMLGGMVRQHHPPIMEPVRRLDMTHTSIPVSAWRTTLRYPEYEVNEAGQIRSAYTMRPLKGGIDKDGYRKIVICSNGQRFYRRIATIVAETFHGPRPEGMVLRHLDGSRTNDLPENLRWGTQAENMADKKAHGTSQKGAANPNSKLTLSQVVEIKFSGANAADLARKFGIHRAHVHGIRSGRSWAHVVRP